ncbi:MAG: bifunctional oligoribonuclease/PAP phosphatase NrnA [Bacteroidota bacterium]
MKIVSALKKLLSAPKHIVITMHTRPDADALGASLGLATFLKQKQHTVSIIAPTAYPNFLAWLPGITEVIVYSEGHHALCTERIKKADIIFCIDFTLLHRINELSEVVKNATATKVVIDHHLDKEDFADLVLRRPGAAATAELIYQLIKDLDAHIQLNKDIATCLYVGIITDTASFKNANTTPHVHRVAANLIELGADVARTNRLVYENNSLDRLQFISFAISQRLVVLPAYHTAYFAIQASDAKRFNLTTGDTEGLVNHALSIRGIVLAALISEKEDVIRLSLRSIGNFPVNVFAKEHFAGGGHKHASGGTSHLSLQETTAKFEALVNAHQRSLAAAYEA